MHGDSFSEGKESESSPPKRACRRFAIKPNSIEAEQLAEFSMNIVLSQTSIDACDESKVTNSSDSDSDSDTEDENDTAESKNDQPKYSNSDDYKSDSKISTDNNTNSKDVDTKDDDSK